MGDPPDVDRLAQVEKGPDLEIQKLLAGKNLSSRSGPFLS